jgi:phosphate transport system substrate-binding protein
MVFAGYVSVKKKAVTAFMDLSKLFGGGDFWINLFSLLIGIGGLIFTVWTYYRSKQRKLITYEYEDKDTNVVSVDRDKGEDIKIFLDDMPVEEVRYQLIKIRNEGNVSVDSDDYKKPLLISFAPRQGTTISKSLQFVVRAGIPEASPSLGISSHNARDYIILNAEEQYVALKDVLLNAGDWIRIKVLTLGKADIAVTGQIKDGMIKQYVPAQSFLTWRNAVLYLLLGGLLFFLVYNSIGLISAFGRGDCAFGSIQVKGSSAFYNTAQGYADGYRSACPVGFVQVSEDTSSSGLRDLKNGDIQIANSELSGSAAGLTSTDYEDHRVAVIVFTVVVNRDITGITSLTRDQLLKIYNGNYRSWNAVDSRAPNIPIRVFGRPTTSGTYGTFTSYVLGTEASGAPGYQEIDKTSQVAPIIAQTPGAIGYVDEGTAGRNSSSLRSIEIDGIAPTYTQIENNVYPFWAIEHMYTKKNPSTLANSFITYAARNIQTNDTFIKLSDMPVTVLQTRS